MKVREVRIGTRGSALAVAQANLVATALEAVGARVRLVIVETSGDRRDQDTPWGEGAFVAGIEAELLAGTIDIAVHSAKDLPTTEDPRLRIGAYLARADSRDALVTREGFGSSVEDLPRGARVGTDSPRRTGFLLARRPDLHVHPLHGNVDTRLRRLDDGETEALVLACAGLDRLGLGGRIAQRIPPEVMPPAAGQGAIAVQVRSMEGELIDMCAKSDHLPTRVAVEFERAFLAASGGGCRSPIGAFATCFDHEVDLFGGYVGTDGSDARFGRVRGASSDGDQTVRGLLAILGAAPAVAVQEATVIAT